MAMERENYRINLEAVISAFQNKPLLTVSEVAKYLHKRIGILLEDRNFVKLCFEVGGRTHITRESLAHYISGR